MHRYQFLFCASALLAAPLNAMRPVLFLESAGKISHDYRNFLSLTRSVGFEPTFHNFYSAISDTKIQKRDTIFLLCDQAILKNIKHSLAQKYIKCVEALVRSGNKRVAVFLPHGIKPEAATTFLEILAIRPPEDQSDFVSHINHILAHDVHKGRLWGSTLINPTPTTAFNHEHYVQLINKESGELSAFSLPSQDFTCDPLVAQTFPLALCWADKNLNNTYMIANAADFTFCEITENFFSTPLSWDLREHRLLAAQRVLQEFYELGDPKGFTQPIVKKTLALPRKLTKEFNFGQKKTWDAQLKLRLKNSPDYSWILKHQLLCGWLDPDDYFLEESQTGHPTALERGIDFLYSSGINLAWFEFNPELVLSSNATQKNRPTMNRMMTLSTELDRQAQKNKLARPQFFVGTDITLNYRTVPVPHVTKDLFGNSYSKIPCPLDFEGFWKPELLDVLDAVLKETNGKVTIDGIFLDFEMYHAQDQASQYDDFMDFSDLAWKAYASRSKKPELLSIISVDDRTSYLAHNNLFMNYFQTLTNVAREIGQKIKSHIKSKLPHALIAAYAMTLPSSWFYRGIMAGLSSAQEPLILATFNTDFYSHAAWLEKQGIFLIHGTVIMLSKIQQKQDARLIKDLLEMQPFVWFNRPSRMIHPQKKRKNIWWESEASPMDADELATTIRHCVESHINQ